LNTAPTVKCSNYIGEAIDFTVSSGFETILLVGHLGKFVKLAGGIMNTHSSVADCRKEIISAHAALCGADRETIRMLMKAVTTEESIAILDTCGLRDAVLTTLLTEIQDQLHRRAGEHRRIGAMIFSNTHGYLGQTEAVPQLLQAY
jgi:cobalt-precorrin-5B (C1)-methyltransferase